MHPGDCRGFTLWTGKARGVVLEPESKLKERDGRCADLVLQRNGDLGGKSLKRKGRGMARGLHIERVFGRAIL